MRRGYHRLEMKGFYATTPRKPRTFPNVNSRDLFFLWSSHIELSDFENDGNDLALMGRLRPGVTLAQAQVEAVLLFPKLDNKLRLPTWTGGHQGILLGLKDYVSWKLRQSLIVLWCAVGIILLIVCVNLLNLLLARTAARS